MNAETTSDMPLPMTAARPDPEVLPVPLRRRFTGEYKRKVLQELEERRQAGLDTGSVLRREGLYRSHITKWQRAEASGGADALDAQRPGPKPDPERPQRLEIERLLRENARLEARLKKAEFVIDVQKKVSQLLGLDDPSEQLLL
jgi:transposase-like protein